MTSPAGRTRPRRRPAPGRPQILQVALDLIDREGAQALTMRRLAEELGTSPMSLYGNVIDRDDVLDGLYDLILREVDLSGADDLPWQQWVRRAWGSYRAALLRHPNALTAIMRRPLATTPGMAYSAATELPLRVFRNAGLSPDAAVHAYRMLNAFVFGTTVVEANFLERHSVLADRRSVILPVGNFPNLTEALPFFLQPDFEGTYELGLTLLIQGLEQTIGADRDA
ncbi:MAG TPA: TetR/AcrR family transcriptional regulator C-terminal domain-containing protein [Mycobacteriales bacterium]|nr:TetR/AcrR family transcriptional regulator C-terminal domain-containing protein [Mycobacteriales bacterium]